MANRANKIRRVQNTTINKKVFEDLAELLAGRSDPLPKGAFTMRQAVGTKLGKSASSVCKSLKLLVEGKKLTRKKFRIYDGRKYRNVPYYF